MIKNPDIEKEMLVKRADDAFDSNPQIIPAKNEIIMPP